MASELPSSCHRNTRTGKGGAVALLTVTVRKLFLLKKTLEGKKKAKRLPFFVCLVGCFFFKLEQKDGNLFQHVAFGSPAV